MPDILRDSFKVKHEERAKVAGNKLVENKAKLTQLNKNTIDKLDKIETDTSSAKTELLKETLASMNDTEFMHMMETMLGGCQTWEDMLNLGPLYTIAVQQLIVRMGGVSLIENNGNVDSIYEEATKNAVKTLQETLKEKMDTSTDQIIKAILNKPMRNDTLFGPDTLKVLLAYYTANQQNFGSLLGVNTVATDTVATDTVATDTVATDTVATDTVATDTVATDTVAKEGKESWIKNRANTTLQDLVDNGSKISREKTNNDFTKAFSIYSGQKSTENVKIDKLQKATLENCNDPKVIAYLRYKAMKGRGTDKKIFDTVRSIAKKNGILINAIEKFDALGGEGFLSWICNEYKLFSNDKKTALKYLKDIKEENPKMLVDFILKNKENGITFGLLENNSHTIKLGDQTLEYKDIGGRMKKTGNTA